jgi:hypothetical protein
MRNEKDLVVKSLETFKRILLASSVEVSDQLLLIGDHQGTRALDAWTNTLLEFDINLVVPLVLQESSQEDDW